MQILMVIEELNMQYQYYTFAVSLMFGFIYIYPNIKGLAWEITNRKFLSLYSIV